MRGTVDDKKYQRPFGWFGQSDFEYPTASVPLESSSPTNLIVLLKQIPDYPRYSSS